MSSSSKPRPTNEASKQTHEGVAANTARRADSVAPGSRIETPIRPPTRGLTALPEPNPYSWATPSARQTSSNYWQRVRSEMPHQQSHSSPSQRQSRDTTQTAHEENVHGQEERATRVENRPNLNATVPPFTLYRHGEVQQPTPSVEAERRFNPSAASFDPRQIQPPQQGQSLVRAAQAAVPGLHFGYNTYSSPEYQSGGPLKYGNQGGQTIWGPPGPLQSRQEQTVPADFRFPAVPTGPRHLSYDGHRGQRTVPMGSDFSSLPANPQQQTSDPRLRAPTGPAAQQVQEPSHGRNRKPNRHKHHREPKHKIGYPCPDYDPHCHVHHSDVFCHLPWQDCQLARKAIGASFHAHNQWKGAPTGWNEEHNRCVRGDASTGDMCTMHRRIYLESLQSHERELLQSFRG